MLSESLTPPPCQEQPRSAALGNAQQRHSSVKRFGMREFIMSFRAYLVVIDTFNAMFAPGSNEIGLAFSARVRSSSESVPEGRFLLRLVQHFPLVNGQ